MPAQFRADLEKPMLLLLLFACGDRIEDDTAAVEIDLPLCADLADVTFTEPVTLTTVNSETYVDGQHATCYEPVGTGVHCYAGGDVALRFDTRRSSEPSESLWLAVNQIWDPTEPPVEQCFGERHFMGDTSVVFVCLTSDQLGWLDPALITIGE